MKTLISRRRPSYTLALRRCKNPPSESLNVHKNALRSASVLPGRTKRKGARRKALLMKLIVPQVYIYSVRYEHRYKQIPLY